MTQDLFDASPDPVLGDALRAALGPGTDAAFAAGFRAAMAEESPWSRFAAWTWPGLVAAAATLALAVGLWSMRSEPAAATLEQAFASSEEAQVIVAATDRPGSEAVLAAAFGGDQ